MHFPFDNCHTIYVWDVEDLFNTYYRWIVKFHIYLWVSIFTFLTKKNWMSPKSPYYVPTILCCYMGLTRRILRMYQTDLSILKEKGSNTFALPHISFHTIKNVYMYLHLVKSWSENCLHVCIKFYIKIHIYWKLFYLIYQWIWHVPVCYIYLKGVIQDLNFLNNNWENPIKIKM